MLKPFFPSGNFWLQSQSASSAAAFLPMPFFCRRSRRKYARDNILVIFLWSSRIHCGSKLIQGVTVARFARNVQWNFLCPWNLLEYLDRPFPIAFFKFRVTLKLWFGDWKSWSFPKWTKAIFKGNQIMKSFVAFAEAERRRRWRLKKTS